MSTARSTPNLSGPSADDINEEDENDDQAAENPSPSSSSSKSAAIVSRLRRSQTARQPSRRPALGDAGDNGPVVVPVPRFDDDEAFFDSNWALYAACCCSRQGGGRGLHYQQQNFAASGNRVNGLNGQQQQLTMHDFSLVEMMARDR